MIIKKIISFSFILIALQFNSFIGIAQEYSIQMRLNTDDTFSHNIKLDMAVNVQGLDITMNMESECAFKVLPPAPDGKQLKMSYTKINLTTNNPFLSGKTSDSISKAAQQKLIGKYIILKLDSNNQVKEVVGFDSLLSQNKDPFYQQTAKQMFSKSQIDDLFGMMFSIYPNKPVKIGDSWNITTTKNINGVPMNINLTYTLNEIKNGFASISLDGIIKVNGQMTTKGMNLPITMNGTEKGAIQITLANGYLHHAAYDMNIDGSIDANNQKIPMTIKGTFIMGGK